MRICLLGSGGREHALAWKLTQSSFCDHLYIAPGNPGTSGLGTNVPLDINDHEAIARFLRRQAVDMLVVGPEAPLVAGLRDYLHDQEGLSNLLIVGPGAEGAKLEGSKDFSKQFMLRHGVPTAAANTFDKSTLAAGEAFLESMAPPYVLKADGLAAGKGVIITEDLAEAKSQLRQMLEGKFGEASSQVLIEEFLSGIELSVFILTDGVDYVLLPEAKDYKRIGEGDTGPNTGGMGAVSPVPFADQAFMDKVKSQVIAPTLKGLQAEGISYKGFIFIGLMNVDGEPKVIEYNVRMGDPETQAVLMRLDGDLAELCRLCAEGRMSEAEYTVKPDVAATVVLVSGGYPGSYPKGLQIDGAYANYSAEVFHAGTKQEAGKLLTNGGRVFGLTGKASTLKSALAKAYAAAEGISFDGKTYRRDIGNDLA